MPGAKTKLLFIDAFPPRKAKNREIFVWRSCPASQSIGRGRISREGALDLRESRERRDKIFAEKKKTPKKWIKNSSFQWGIFIFLAAEKLTFFGGGINSKLASQ